MKRYYITISAILLVLISFVILPFSCENNNEFDLYGIEDCDTTDLTWDDDIADIMNKNCVQCHGPVTSYNKVRHDSYASEMVVVKDGRLKGVINHLPGYSKMPKDRGKLPACELLKINTWIENGAPEN